MFYTVGLDAHIQIEVAANDPEDAMEKAYDIMYDWLHSASIEGLELRAKYATAYDE